MMMYLYRTNVYRLSCYFTSKCVRSAFIRNDIGLIRVLSLCQLNLNPELSMCCNVCEKIFGVTKYAPRSHERFCWMDRHTSEWVVRSPIKCVCYFLQRQRCLINVSLQQCMAQAMFFSVVYVDVYTWIRCVIIQSNSLLTENKLLFCVLLIL